VVQEYHLRYRSVICGTGVSFGVQEYHLGYRSIIWGTGVSFAVQEYHLGYRSITFSSTLLKVTRPITSICTC
jgi:hypothetical protein